MNKKLLLIESEMSKPQGHFLDYLIETSIYFKSNRKIIWFLNKKFNEKNINIPDFCEIKKIIKSNKFNIKKKRFFYFLEEIFFFIINIYNIFFFTFFFFKSRKKLICFYICLISNYFIIPRYFKSFYFDYVKLNFNSEDDIVFQSCRRKDLSLIYFLSNIEQEKLPKIHLRIFHLPNNRFKGFDYYINLLKPFLLTKKIFLYTEDGFKKDYLKKYFNCEDFINISKHVVSFFERKNDIKKHVIGFVGEARINKGFNEIPELINKINKLGLDVEFLIHSTDIDKNTQNSFAQLTELNKKYNNITLINEYCDYYQYRKLLKNITIMPLNYNIDQINIGSGILYSCISHEIIPIIPSKTDYLEEVLVSGSNLSANNLDQFANSILEIIKNYDNFLNKIKISSKKLKYLIDNDILVKNILN